MNDAVRPQARLLSLVARTRWSNLRAALAGLVSPLRTSAPLRAGLVATIGCYVALQVLLCIHVHVSFEGNYAGPFLISKAFGVPAKEAANGVRVIEPMPGSAYLGWDSQFYYHVSNDLWITRDAKAHMDNPSYRYQRVGVPMLAHAASKLLGGRITSPFVYHAVQLLATAVGFGGLVFWLTAHGLPRYYALAWLLSAGTYLTLRFGMPDTACDGFLILAVLGAYYRRLAVYVPAAALMCLGRETYVAFPFALWVCTATNRFAWPGVRHYWLRVVLTAVPGVVVLGWAVFVSHRLHLPLLHGARIIPWGGLTDYPFVAGVDAVRKAWASGDVAETEHVLAAFGTLAAVVLVALRHAWKSAVVACVLPFVGLLTMAGGIVWSSYHMGSAKNVLPAVAVGVFLLAWSRGLFLRAVLLLQIVIGMDVIFAEAFVRTPQFSADHAAVSIFGSPFAPPPPPLPGPRITDFRCRITATVLSTQDDPAYHGIWRWCHRESTKVRVRVENTSAQTWKRDPTAGDFAVQFGYFLKDEDGKDVGGYGYALPRDVPPGDSFEQVYPLPLMKLNGKYSVQYSLVQHKDCWFFWREPGSSCTIPVEFHSARADR